MAKVQKKAAPPTADMYKAFTEFKENYSKNLRTRLLSDMKPEELPQHLQISYSQEQQSLRIIDLDANNGNGLMITVKYNQYDENYNDYIDKGYIRPIKGAPSGIGAGWHFQDGHADGSQQYPPHDGYCKAYENFYNDLSIKDKNLAFDTAFTLMAFHMDHEECGIPCTHQDEYITPTPEERARWEARVADCKQRQQANDYDR